MKKFRIIIAVLSLFVVTAATYAQTVPSFREKGYKGNIGVETLMIYPSLTSSHGYMFNDVHYFGAGLFLSVFPESPDIELFAGTFLEYKAYLLHRNSTPVVGVRASCLMGMEVGEDEWMNYMAGLSPSFGWSWGIGRRKQYGIMPYTGCHVLYVFEEAFIQPLPFLGVVFEF